MGEFTVTNIFGKAYTKEDIPRLKEDIKRMYKLARNIKVTFSKDMKEATIKFDVG